MNKFLSIALGLAIALTIVAPAAADPPMTAQERGELAGLQSGGEGSGQQIIAQERGRRADPRVFSPSPARPDVANGWADQIVDPYGTLALRELKPVQVVGPEAADGFDFADAAVGGAVVGALTLLAAAGLAVGRTRTRRALSMTS